MRVITDLYFPKHAARLTCPACNSTLEATPLDVRYAHQHGPHLICPCCQKPIPSPFTEPNQ